jgi:hypothetical protein
LKIKISARANCYCVRACERSNASYHATRTTTTACATTTTSNYKVFHSWSSGKERYVAQTSSKCGCFKPAC